MNKILRVWGCADEIPLELYEDGGKWKCSLPPDLEDGQYAAQLFALKSNGMTGVWTGVLYIANGLCCIKLKQEKYTLRIMPERVNIRLTGDCRHA